MVKTRGYQIDDVYFIDNLVDCLPCESCGEKLPSVRSVFGLLICDSCMIELFVRSRKKNEI